MSFILVYTKPKKLNNQRKACLSVFFRRRIYKSICSCNQAEKELNLKRGTYYCNIKIRKDFAEDFNGLQKN